MEVTGEKRETDINVDIYLDTIGKTLPLSQQEEVSLAAKSKLGDLKARNRLIEANLRFVVSVAAKYRGKGLPLSELICAGNMGLIKAVEYFDESRGFKFISYAVWWIRQSIQNALYEQTRIIHQPWNRIGKMNSFLKFSEEFKKNFERKPTTKEIADEFGMPEERVLDHQVSNQWVMSLDAPMTEDGNPLSETVADESQIPSDEKALNVVIREKMIKAVNTLEDRDAEIIRLYFGLDGDSKTLEEIGQVYGLTRERVRQIKAKALKTLKYRFKAESILSS